MSNTVKDPMNDLHGEDGGRGNGPSALVQSVDRALSVLEIIARRGEAGVTQIAEELGVHKSTASRLVSVLERRGFVEQVSQRGKYRLGFGIVRLAGAATAELDLSRFSRDVCERLANDLGETVNIAVLDDGHAINISQVRGMAQVGAHNWVGQRTPLHATSSGKALLAFQPPEVQEAVIARGLDRYTDHTVTDAGALRKALAEVRAQGWASTREELEIGLNAVAAPVRDHRGVVAAISVSGPSYRMGTAILPKVVEQVTEAAAAVSARLGHLG
jgi:IclR family acetate operon transcriptional repressor